MDTTKLKKFAQYARALLIEQVGTKLNQVLADESPARRESQQAVASLEAQVRKLGETQLIEQVAYTWFNRFCALRFMDVNGYNRVQVLSPLPGQFQPEILSEAKMGLIDDEHGTPAIRQRITDLLGGKIQSSDPQGEAYRLLVVAACNSWHSVMPFLFEKIADYTELLLPDDLLSGNSILSYTREALTAANCSPENTDESVEVLGWLYQFYIAEKKDAVMARKKAVPSEDIPAVTQLFTPHWIVRYLVENSLGRLWLNSRPDSRLREHMPYYVEDPEPAESSAEASAKEGRLTVGTPEEIKLLDPACGSGHMLTYAFDLLVKIYEEEGHAPSEIPEKILTHNLFGLEICPRAAQLASFALVCKAREQSRRAFRSPVQPQVMCLRDVVLTPDEVKGFAEATGVKFSQDELAQIHQFRENTETFGALIQPVLDGEKLAALVAKIGEQPPPGDLLVQNTHRNLRLVLDQAEMLSQRYQVVVANPPYMGGKGMNGIVKGFLSANFPDYKADLFSAFISRSLNMTVQNGGIGFMSPFVWMFIGSYEKLRERIIDEATINTLVQLEYSGFDGATVPICAFVFQNGKAPDYLGGYIRLTDFRGAENQGPKTLEAISNPDCGWFYRTSTIDFKSIPGCPIAYWASPATTLAFQELPALGSHLTVKAGMSTTDNQLFLRLWHEIQRDDFGIGFTSREDTVESRRRWFPYIKGGSFRKWAGNNDYVVNWRNDGEDIRNYIAARPEKQVGGRLVNMEFFFRPCVSWTRISSGSFSARFYQAGSIFSDASNGAFGVNDDVKKALLFLNSRVAAKLLELISPTLNYYAGDIAMLPFAHSIRTQIVNELYDIANPDWDNFETSWDFRDLPLLRPGDWEVEPGQPGGAWKGRTLAESWANYASYCAAAIRRMQELETENNRLWIAAYGLQDELDPAVPEDEITLARADARKDMAAFLSYAVGCMMGRYSLDHPGLILADAGDTLEQYFDKVGKSEDEVTFLPDDDAIIPILEGEWFDDDITERFKKFLKASFPEEHYEENLEWLENALYPTNLEGKKRKTVQDYFLKDFYKDHVQTYKKRPIYWLFSSPKGSFNALIYLHRYTKTTVSQVLNDYLREFKTKLSAKLENLQHLEASSDASKKDKTAALKEIKSIKSTLIELDKWEKDTLFPLAQQQLEIDLDDGVKANYPKFGNALKKIPGLS